jgi:hypothetical protein
MIGQVPTRAQMLRRMNLSAVMGSPAFRLGAETARAGLPWPRTYEQMRAVEQRQFERGRMWGRLAPPGLLLMHGGSVTPAAMEIYLQGRADDLIL